MSFKLRLNYFQLHTDVRMNKEAVHYPLSPTILIVQKYKTIQIQNQITKSNLKTHLTITKYTCSFFYWTFFTEFLSYHNGPKFMPNKNTNINVSNIQQFVRN